MTVSTSGSAAAARASASESSASSSPRRASGNASHRASTWARSRARASPAEPRAGWPEWSSSAIVPFSGLAQTATSAPALPGRRTGRRIAAFNRVFRRHRRMIGYFGCDIVNAEPRRDARRRQRSDFRSRPELDCMTGISRPSRPPEHSIVVAHGTFSGLAEIAGASDGDLSLRRSSGTLRRRGGSERPARASGRCRLAAGSCIRPSMAIFSTSGSYHRTGPWLAPDSGKPHPAQSVYRHAGTGQAGTGRVRHKQDARSGRVLESELQPGFRALRTSGCMALLNPRTIDRT